MNDFETKIRQIFYLVGEFGIDNTPDYQPVGMSEQGKRQFLVNCRKGFRQGQDLMVQETIFLLKDLKNKKAEEKEAQKNKGKEQLEAINLEIDGINHKLAILRHFADFLAWMFLKNEWHKIRRLYSGSKSRPNLLESNLDSVVESIKYFHSQDEMNFALITDLTSFIDVGDLLLVTADKINIVECKSGDVQRRVYEFIEELQAEEFDASKVDYSKKDFKFFDQLERTLRQHERNSHAVKFLNTEKGIDPFVKKKINLVTTSERPEYYFDTLANVAENSFIEDSAYDIVEDIIYIAAYRNSKLKASYFLFDQMAQKIIKEYVPVDLMQLLYAPLKEPLFFKPIGKEILFDLLFDRLKIYLALDINKLVDLFNEKGVAAKWLTPKATKRYLSKGGSKPFVFKGRAIEVTSNGHILVLGTTFTVNLLLDNLTPSTIVARYATLSPAE